MVIHAAIDLAGGGPSDEAYEAGDEDQDERTLLKVACHDVCAPLSAIHLHLQTFRKHLEQGKAPTLEKVVELIDRLERLALEGTRLVNDVLSVERSTPAPVLAEEVDLDDALESAISFHREALRRAQSTIIVTRDVERFRLRGSWDPRALESIFSNLLQNASRHAAGAPIAIHLSRTEDEMLIVFADGGPGLPETPSGGHGSTRAPADGHGLGLWIVRRAVAQLGGTLSMRNGTNVGLVFEIRIPFDRALL